MIGFLPILRMKLPELPVPLRQLLGPTVSDYFIDYLQELMQLQREEVVQMSMTQFDRRLFQEISGIRLDMSEMREEYRSGLAELKTEMAELRTELKTEMVELRAELKTEMGELRTELKTDVAELRSDFASLRAETSTQMAHLRAEVKADIAGVHHEISLQTKWILAAMATFTVLYPVLSQVVARLLPA